MARHEYQHPTEKKRLAIGVDSFLTPGDPTPDTFLQIWDTSESDQPCDEGKGGFNNIITGRIGLPYDEAFEVARSHGFTVTREEIFEIFD